MGIHEVVIFHSTIDDLRHYERDLPFAVIADPDKRLYVEFGVEGSPRALLDPRAWLPIARAVLHCVQQTIREGRPVPPVVPRGGSLGLPADVLIASDGRVLAFKYGRHADDQWSIDELLTLVRAMRKRAEAAVSPQSRDPQAKRTVSTARSLNYANLRSRHGREGDGHRFHVKDNPAAPCASGDHRRG